MLLQPLGPTHPCYRGGIRTRQMGLFGAGTTRATGNLWAQPVWLKVTNGEAADFNCFHMVDIRQTD